MPTGQVITESDVGKSIQPIKPLPSSSPFTFLTRFSGTIYLNRVVRDESGKIVGYVVIDAFGNTRYRINNDNNWGVVS